MSRHHFRSHLDDPMHIKQESLHQQQQSHLHHHHHHQRSRESPETGKLSRLIKCEMDGPTDHDLDDLDERDYPESSDVLGPEDIDSGAEDEMAEDLSMAPETLAPSNNDENSTSSHQSHFHRSGMLVPEA